MANEYEIHEAVNIIKEQNNNNIILLHCTAAYPTPIEEANLITINEISNKFSVLAGLEDHTLGTKIATYACVMGACVIEKHFTLDRKEGGVDSKFSIEPKELKKLIESVKEIKLINGEIAFSPTKSEANVLKTRRSLYVVKDIMKGEKITKENIKSIRPGKGLPPKYINQIIGSYTTRDLKYGEPLRVDMFNKKLNIE